jgi:hypothetical protein
MHTFRACDKPTVIQPDAKHAVQVVHPTLHQRPIEQTPQRGHAVAASAHEPLAVRTQGEDAIRVRPRKNAPHATRAEVPLAHRPVLGAREENLRASRARVEVQLRTVDCACVPTYGRADARAQTGTAGRPIARRRSLLEYVHSVCASEDACTQADVRLVQQLVVRRY